MSAAAPDDIFDDLFSSPQMSTGTATAADEVQVYSAVAVWGPLSRGQGRGRGESGGGGGLGSHGYNFNSRA